MLRLKSLKELNLQSHPFITCSELLCDLMQPIENYFGFNHFEVMKVFMDGSVFMCSSHPEWLSEFIKGGLYLHGEQRFAATSYRKKKIISTLSSDEEFLWQRKKESLGLYNVICFIEPVSDGCEFYYFGTTNENQEIMNFAISNLELLEKFVANFPCSGARLFDELFKARVKADDFANELVTHSGSNQSKKVEFLSNIYNYNLTLREITYMELLSKGCSLKQISEQLNLSYRTVEEYVAKLKIKTNSNSIIELAQHFVS